MISRRDLAIAVAAIGAPRTGWAQKLPVPKAGRLAFRMLRKGDVIGMHELKFSEAGGNLTVSIAIDILVKLGPIPVYRYTHRGTERWQEGAFVGIETKTDHDGSPQFMRATRTAEGVVVEGSMASRYVAPPTALPTTYWNRRMLQANVINSEDGRLFHVNPVQLADEAVPTADGAAIRARHYKLDGQLLLDLWYDEADQWAHLVFTRDGSTITYERL